MKEGIHSIIQKINLDAQNCSNERYTNIKNDINEEIAGENVHHREESDKRQETLIKHNEQEYIHQTERLESRLNREIVIYQHELTNEIFDIAVLKLRKVSNEEFFDMFKMAVKGLNGNYNLFLGEFSAGKLDTQKIKEAVKGNRELNIILSDGTIPNKSGFIFKNDTVEYNCLFEDLIDEKKNEQAASILKEVFEN